ncbi:MAG: ATP-dependent Clp protease adaptor ClpS [Ktedonobacterales bacterium]|nr:ATP-dependent Clp protease adaptor ClpS [Ktedonobacterales bacterium]
MSVQPRIGRLTATSHGGAGDETGVAAPRTDDEVRQALRQLPRYRVILHNDDEHEMHEVVMALVRTVPSLTIARAGEIMLTAHLHGQAQVIICPKELAEHYRDGLRRYGLISTIEPA